MHLLKDVYASSTLSWFNKLLSLHIEWYSWIYFLEHTSLQSMFRMVVLLKQVKYRSIFNFSVHVLNTSDGQVSFFQSRIRKVSCWLMKMALQIKQAFLVKIVINTQISCTNLEITGIFSIISNYIPNKLWIISINYT